MASQVIYLARAVRPAQRLSQLGFTSMRLNIGSHCLLSTSARNLQISSFRNSSSLDSVLRPQNTSQSSGRTSLSGQDNNATLSSILYQTGTSAPPPRVQSLPPRLGSTAGRSVAVRGGDVAGAFLQLRRICNENYIARDASQQRFYERPGLKKKRLRRERFRRRFKESFKRMVNTVLEMKRQGI